MTHQLNSHERAKEDIGDKVVGRNKSACLDNVSQDSLYLWPRFLRRGSTASRMPGLRIRILPGA
jgi:uncharacterized protein involved in tolerance to divalent cations